MPTRHEVVRVFFPCQLTLFFFLKSLTIFCINWTLPRDNSQSIDLHFISFLLLVTRYCTYCPLIAFLLCQFACIIINNKSLQHLLAGWMHGDLLSGLEFSRFSSGNFKDNFEVEFSIFIPRTLVWDFLVNKLWIFDFGLKYFMQKSIKIWC